MKTNRIILKAILAAIIVLAVSACVKNIPPQCWDAVDQCLAGALATPEPRVVPRPAETSTQTPNVAPTSTQTPQATPTEAPRPTVATSCDPATPSVYNADVRRAMQSYQEEHPEQFDGTFFKFPLSQDVFFNGIIAKLKERNLDGLIDPCMCGDLVVASHDTPIGFGFAEGYHPLSSERLVQSVPYRERCTPRWF